MKGHSLRVSDWDLLNRIARCSCGTWARIVGSSAEGEREFEAHVAEVKVGDQGVLL